MTLSCQETVSTIYPDRFRFVNHEVLLFTSEQWNTKSCDEWNSAWCTHRHTSKYGEVPTSDTYTDESTILDRMIPIFSSSQSYQIMEVHHVYVYIYILIHLNMSIPFRSWQLHVFLCPKRPVDAFKRLLCISCDEGALAKGVQVNPLFWLWVSILVLQKTPIH